MNRGSRFIGRPLKQMSDILYMQIREGGRLVKQYLTLHTHFTLNLNASFRQVPASSDPPRTSAEGVFSSCLSWTLDWFRILDSLCLHVLNDKARWCLYPLIFLAFESILLYFTYFFPCVFLHRLPTTLHFCTQLKCPAPIFIDLVKTSMTSLPPMGSVK